MWLVVLHLWAWACFGMASSDIIGKVGDKVVLTPSDVPQEITSIIWKYGPNFAAQWDGNSEQYYRHFKKQAKLNLENGALTVYNLTLDNSNDYTPEINNILHKKIVLKVLRPVPTPKLRFTNNILLCDGDTEDAGPVDYFWSSDNMPRPDLDSSKSKSFQVKGCSHTFTCTMRNPVSESTSNEVYIICWYKIIVGVLVAVVIVGLFGLAVFHKIKTKEWFYQKGLKCWTADFWTDTTTDRAKDNGVGAGENSPMAAVR